MFTDQIFLPVALLEAREIAVAAEHVEAIAFHRRRAARPVAAIVFEAPPVLRLPDFLAGRAIERDHIFNAGARAERIETPARC